MVELKDLRKTYKLNNLEVLKGINLKFGDLGFTSILGPSGCGKTTLLNIIGGLDRATSGDLLIDNISTSTYKEKDWDHYRNENVGFVFQDFNLIGHLSIFKNVELSLTLTGISKKERIKKVNEALDKVGLLKLKNNLPKRLSGGERQRVAIARAIVNNPKIILADEPTGSLDSATSIQILDILKEISKEHLVIMVTHNEEFARNYSNRIIKLLDGTIISDENNEEFVIKEKEEKAKHKKMSLFGALFVSFKNLLLKWPRTILTIFAGSIGIVGVSLVLAVSSGVTNYIGDIQKVALGNYPITVTSSVKSSPQVSVYDDKKEFPSDEVVTIVKGDTLYEHLNVIEEDFFDYFDKLDKSLYSWVNYNRTIKLDILSKNNDSYKKVSTSYLYEMTDNFDIINDNYDCLYGHFPTEYNEVAILIDSYNCIDAQILYYMGMDIEKESYTFSELLSQEFKLITSDEAYVKSGDRYYQYGSSYYDDLYENAKVTLKISGIMRIKPDSKSEIYQSSFLYTSALTDYVYETNLNSDIVKEQLEYGLSKNVFTGEEFKDEENLNYTLSKEYIYEYQLKDLGIVKQVNRFYIYTENFSDRLVIEEYIDDYKNVNPDSYIRITYSDYMKRITEEFSTFVKILTKVLIIFALISLLVSSILISIISYISVLERTKEIGILRSIGASRFDIFSIFSSEAMMIGVSSGILGVILAHLFASPISNLVKRLIEENSSMTTNLKSFRIVNFTLTQTVVIVAGSIVLTLISALIPTIIASLKKPIDALKSSNE